MEIQNTVAPYRFLVGSYTNAEDQGVYLLEFDPNGFGLRSNTLIDSIENPSFVIASKDDSRVYSLEETDNENGGQVMGYLWNQDKLQMQDSSATFGGAPCYLSLSPEEDFLVAANYSGGNLSIYKTDEKASLEWLQTMAHSGSSIDESRQEKPHVHSVVFDPEGKRLLAADLGTDKVYIYSFDPTSNEPLSLKQSIDMSPGDGPRHITFSPDGKEMVVLAELTGYLNVYNYEASGAVNLKERLSLFPEGFQGQNGAAEVRFSPDGKNIYASNRGDANSLSVFSKTENGSYERIQQISSGGIMPRNFNLTKDGKYLLSAHQASNDVVVFERDLASGSLKETDWKISLHMPIYLYRLDDQN